MTGKSDDLTLLHRVALRGIWYKVIMIDKGFTQLDLSEKIGKETIKAHSYSLSKRNGDSESYRNMARSLLTPDEIEQMTKAHELVFITGVKPIQTRKYDLKSHPNFKHSGECSAKNNYDLKALIGENTPDIRALDDASITENEVRDFKFS